MSRALDGRVNNQHGTFLLPHASQSLNCALLGFQNATLTLRQEHWPTTRNKTNAQSNKSSCKAPESAWNTQSRMSPHSRMRNLNDRSACPTPSRF
eukprot:jgi/Bigna1/61303/fgenesh1_kg.20_\